jgi:hypothetical protein
MLCSTITFYVCYYVLLFTVRKRPRPSLLHTPRQLHEKVVKILLWTHFVCDNASESLQSEWKQIISEETSRAASITQVFDGNNKCIKCPQETQYVNITS